jgi:phage shock protein PspC (stress-responsive transcriptional regulator)
MSGVAMNVEVERDLLGAGAGGARRGGEGRRGDGGLRDAGAERECGRRSGRFAGAGPRITRGVSVRGGSPGRTHGGSPAVAPGEPCYRTRDDHRLRAAREERRVPLRRSRKHKMIAGVCGGIAEWLDWDPTVVRIVYVLVSVLSAAFPGIIVYVILWALMPKAPES